MRNNRLGVLKDKSTALIVLSMVLLVMMIVAFLTYTDRYDDGHHPVLQFFVTNHLLVMIVLVVTAVAFGFMWAHNLYGEIRKSQQNSKNMFDLVNLFLSADERTIVNFLVEEGGKATQAEISRLPNLNRVRAHRSLQKMSEKNILSTSAHGKIRKVKLNKNILDTLRNT